MRIAQYRFNREMDYARRRRLHQDMARRRSRRGREYLRETGRKTRRQSRSQTRTPQGSPRRETVQPAQRRKRRAVSPPVAHGVVGEGDERVIIQVSPNSPDPPSFGREEAVDPVIIPLEAAMSATFNFGTTRRK